MIELNGEHYLDGQEASTLLGVKISTLYTYVSRGILKSYRQGIKRQRLYKQVELEALLRLRESDDSSSQNAIPEIPYASDWVSDI
ncbi:helix-turn-helix domain-containing protein [Dictyobacter aurantiacus]|uniref:Helix-turn-helix domain-containing protein n=1 Tax=Dictyobacter aurantiacus TaxID=1936993 RepID=A0A401ZC73_9CHLR|nr:helix-turn-helix domain-containing protein [Dictyobacter aurantiacus]GCE04449.1 hypothetical protein KDAU_17780 [Dictyobacter aurantiacus]